MRLPGHQIEAFISGQGTRVLLLALIPLVSLLLHWRVFPYDLDGIHAIRQAQTYQNIQNFYRHDNSILNPRIHVLDDSFQPRLVRMEFPVMQWVVAQVFHFTGESFLVTRVMMFILGLFTVAGVFMLMRQLFGGFLVPWSGAWAFTFSPVFYFYTTTPMPDNLALCAACWMMALFFHWTRHKQIIYAVASAFFLSLATACKLPYIVFGALPAAWVAWSMWHKRFRSLQNEVQLSTIFLLLMTPAIGWYAWVIPNWHNPVIAGITDNYITWKQVNTYLLHHLEVFFPRRLLNYASAPLLVLGILFGIRNKIWQDPRFVWLAALTSLLFLYLVYEFNMIADVHDYYMMPFLPVLYILVTYGLKMMFNSAIWFSGIAIILLLSMPVVTYELTKEDWSSKYTHHFPEVSRNRELLKILIPKGERVIFINEYTGSLALSMIDRYGYVFANDHLPGEWIRDMHTRCGVNYMLSTSRAVDTTLDSRKYFDRMVFEDGNLKVFTLKVASGKELF